MPGVERAFARLRRLAGAGILLGGVALAGCAGSAASPAGPTGHTRAALERYMRQVEPIRLAVNRLLDTADPILQALHRHRITAGQAASQMDRLERRFAAYAVDVQAIGTRLPALAMLHAQYAHTYILEDAYLSALVAGVASGNLESLPDTQSEQRAAIIAWRTGLTVIARGSGAVLPADLQQAGRGEIAPTPGGS